MKIAFAGTGYVDLSNAVLLAQYNKVVALDIIQEKFDLINNKRSPIADFDIERFLAIKELNLWTTFDVVEAFVDADFVIISTPTNYNPEREFLIHVVLKKSLKRYYQLI